MKLSLGQIVHQKSPKRMAGVMSAPGVSGEIVWIGKKNIKIKTPYGGWAGSEPMMLIIQLPINSLIDSEQI